MNDLTLCVTKNVAGVLETNISALEEFVKNKLEEYNPANYAGDADSAKKSRAELNNAKKELSAARIKLINELMKPYSDFETRCKNLERMIERLGNRDSRLSEWPYNQDYPFNKIPPGGIQWPVRKYGPWWEHTDSPIDLSPIMTMFGF